MKRVAFHKSNRVTYHSNARIGRFFDENVV